MNRQEAIRILKKELEITKGIDKRFGDFPEHREALEMAISSLETAPCEDCISRKEAFEALNNVLGIWGRKVLMELPSVYPKSEQEPILDKIRAEIETLSNANPSYWHSGDMVDREDVLDIIDKYKAETEAEDGFNKT